MFRKAWDQQGERAKQALQAFKRDLRKVEKDLDGYLVRVVETTRPTVIAALEDKIDKMERQKMILNEKIASHDANEGNFEKSIEHALSFFSNPWKIWDSGKFEWQRMLLRLAFADRMVYDRNIGYRTPKFALPFRVLTQNGVQKSEMVPRRGLEPPLPYGN